MRVKEKMFKFVFKVFLLLLCFGSVNLKVKAAENYDVSNYQVNIHVNRNGIFRVKESINVNFTSPSHGIYRTIPTLYEVNLMENNKPYSGYYYFPISHVDVNTMYQESDELNGITLRIGNPNLLVSGSQTYVINYDVVTKSLGLSQDYFYYNIIGNEWTSKIENVDFSLQFDDAIAFEQMKLYAGPYGSTSELEGKCTYNSQLYIIDCKGISLQAYEALTVYLPLGAYFTYPDYTAMYVGFLVAAIVLLLGCIYVFYRYGKDDPLIIPVMFEPVKGVNAAMCGYVLNLQSNTKDFIGLIFEWGKQGIIEIHDEEAGLKLVKVKELDEQAYGFEKTFFSGVFQDGDEVYTNQFKPELQLDVASAKSQLHYFFKAKDHRLMEQRSNTLQQVLFVVISFVFACMVGFAFFTGTYNVVAVIIASAIGFALYMTNAELILQVKKRYFALKKATLLFEVVLIVLGNFIFYTLLLFVLHWLNANIVIMIMFFIILYIAIGFALFIDKRTTYGNRLKGEILGLKHFIEVAEKDRIEMLMKDNPYLFYDILPYAYVLGLADVWEEHFKALTIPQPTYYYGSAGVDFTTLYFFSRLHHSFTYLEKGFAPIPSAAKGTVGGNFGNFSGGGGFSGGGFGGGGGGSW